MILRRHLLHALALCLYFHFVSLVLGLRGALGKRSGTSGNLVGATWNPSGHLGGGTGQSKRTYEVLWLCCFSDLLKFAAVVPGILKRA